MASKGQKFSKYSSELKKEILDKYFTGQGGAKYLAKEYGISHHTITNWVAKTKIGKNVMQDSRKGNSGRPKKDENIDYKERYEILKNYQVFLKAQREKK